MLSGARPVWHVPGIPTTMLSWTSSVERGVAGGDIIVELHPSTKRFNVSRLHMNRLPYFGKLFTWLEKKASSTTLSSPPVRLERVLSGEMKTIFKIEEDRDKLFELFIKILHFTSPQVLWDELERLAHTGDLLPLLEFAREYDHIELVHIIRLKLASLIMDEETTPLDTVLEILAQFDTNVNVDSDDGGWHTIGEGKLMSHPIVIAAMHRLRRSNVEELQYAPNIASIPSLVLMRLIAFAGESNTLSSLTPSWELLTKKRVFADAAIKRERLVIRSRIDTDEHTTDGLNWDRILATSVRESYHDSERLAKNIMICWQRRSPITSMCLQLLTKFRCPLKRTQSDEKNLKLKYHAMRVEQTYGMRAVNNPTTIDAMQIDARSDSVDTHSGWRSRSRSDPQSQSDGGAQNCAVFCETLMKFTDCLGANVSRAISHSVSTPLQPLAPINGQRPNCLDFFLQVERVADLSSNTTDVWEYKLCVRWRPMEAYFALSQPPKVQLAVSSSIWVEGDTFTLPQPSEVHIQDRKLAYEPVSLCSIGTSRGAIPARSIPILIEGFATAQ